MSKYLAKSTITKQKLKDSFMMLYSKKSYCNITVNDIAAHAGVHRCTFYVYFENVNELLREIEDELISGMREESKMLLYIDVKENKNDSSNAKQGLTRICEYLLQHRFYIATLMNPDGDQSFVRKSKKMIHDQINISLNYNHCSYEPNQDVIIWYMSSGIFEAVYRWLKSDALSMDEIVEIMIKMVYFNLFYQIKNVSVFELNNSFQDTNLRYVYIK